MKKKIIISVILISVLFIGLGIFIYVQYLNSLPFKYVCILETKATKKDTVIKYEASVDKNDNIITFYGEKKYIYFNKTDYLDGVYSISLKDVNYEGNKEELTITIHIADGEIINENGEAIYPNYLDYMSHYINDKYNCEVIR